MIEEKSDRTRVRKWQGAYTFQIEGYSGLPARVAEYVESPEFSLCGHKWQLRIFPGGSLETHRDYVSFYLASKSNRVARASYRLIVVNQIPGLEDEGFSSTAVRVFEPKGTQIDGWGRDKFMEGALLKDQDFGFCVNDCVTFKVEMTVFGELETLSGADGELIDRIHNYSLEQSMLQLLQQPVHSDVSFILGADDEPPEVIPAHKCVLLARSPVFYAMFSHPMQEEVSGQIRVTDVTAPVMREVLHFMYTGQRSAAEIDPEDLFRVAVKYQIPGLVAQCEEHFVSQMSVDSVVSLLEMADVYGAQHLKLKCMQFIAQHAGGVVQQRAFHDLDELLRRDVVRLIDAMGKRRGCGGSGVGGSAGGGAGSEKERRIANSCTIM